MDGWMDKVGASKETLTLYTNDDNWSVSVASLLIKIMTVFLTFNEVLMAIPSNITLLSLLSQVKTFKVTTCFSTSTHGMCCCPRAVHTVLEMSHYLK